MSAATDAPPDRDSLERRAHADLPHSASAFQQWLRARLFEHWSGVRYWRELDRNDFGILACPIHPDRALVTDVVAILVTGGENLTVITWALETGRPLDAVVEILTVLDVNARRLARFAWMASPAPAPHRRLRLAAAR